MAMLKYGYASLVHFGLDVDQWSNKVYANAGSDFRIKTARSVIAKYDPRKYLLSHCTIVAAVQTDLANSQDPKSNYLIHPAYSRFVNNNGDAWDKELLKACYRTFIGCNNFVEHVQISELSKGKVIDAVLREIPIGVKNTDGKDLTTYYVDILVATDRKHDDLVRKIQAGEMSQLSMGCQISFSRCTKCGNRAVDEAQACQHVRYEKNNLFYDDQGIQRRVAELCGSPDEPDSVKFVDASWVKQPAFLGAVVRNVVSPPPDVVSKLEAANKIKGYEFKQGDFLKAATLIAQDKPEEPSPEDAPAADAAPEDTAEPPVDPAMETTPPPDMPEESIDETPMEQETEIQKIKTQIKKQVLQQIQQEIADEFKGQEGPRELETLDESIIKPASVVMKEVWTAKKSWDKYLKKTCKNVTKTNFNKLRYGTFILLTSNDPGTLKEYGYDKRSFLGVVSYLDGLGTSPLPLEIKKAVASMGGTSNKAPIEILQEIVKLAGRKITKVEASRAVNWLKMLDMYP